MTMEAIGQALDTSQRNLRQAVNVRVDYAVQVLENLGVRFELENKCVYCIPARLKH